MEHPRPQPEASYTLIYLLLMATVSQAVGEVIRAPEAVIESTELMNKEQIEVDLFRSVLNKTSRFMRWTPAEATAFLPRLFRTNEAREPELIIEDINDDLLISDLSAGREDYIFDSDPPANLFIEDQEKIETIKGTSLHSSSGHRENSKRDSDHLSTLSTSKVDQPPRVPKADHLPSKVKSKTKRALVEPRQNTSPSLVATAKTESITKSKSITKAKLITKTKAISPPSDKLIASKPSRPSSELLTLIKPPHKKRRQRPKRRRSKSGVLIYGIEDEQRALDPFYAKLAEVKSKGRKVRIMHYGDSLIAGDYVTRTTRRLLQKTFGDAGHGYFLAGKGSRWYGRRWVKLKSKGKWTKKRFTRSKIDQGVFGLGGMSFTSSLKNATLSAKPTGIKIGQKVDLVEIHYLAQPHGGSFVVELGELRQEINTHAETPRVKRAVLKLKSSSNAMTKVKLVGDGDVTLYGVVFERRRGGVVYDALGLEGARAKLLLKLFGPMWRHQIRQRSPDLVILHYGTNESQNSRMSIKKYKIALKRIVGQFKTALPKTACMLLSPMDRGVKDSETGDIKSMRLVAKIVRAQREVAADTGCAFWSTYHAMGGRGSMAKWYNASPKLAGGDLTHPTGRGANRIGAMFFASLMDGYQLYRSGQ